jgi:hypothetical protein
MEQHDQTCNRARSWISLRLDHELSELESRSLRAHLKRCRPCRTFEAHLTSITAMIRDDPPAVFASRVTFPSRRKRRLAGKPVWAIAATAVVAVGAMLGTPGAKKERFVPPVVTPAATDSSGVDDVRSLRRADLAAAIVSRQVTKFGYVQRSGLNN